ncbi:VOC family protein [Pseudomonas putida]
MPELSPLISSVEGVDHIAYATRDAKKTAKVFQVLGYEIIIDGQLVKSLNIFATKLQNSKGDVIELVEPTGMARSPVDGLLLDKECCLYHVCHRVMDFDISLERLRAAGALLVTQPFESHLFNGYRHVHVYHPMVGVLELFSTMKKGEVK